MQDVAWTGTPVRPHADAGDNGAESMSWGGRRAKLPLKWPFAKAVAGFRKKALANPQYDPASTFVWGQMMAVGLIEMLKSIEARFGADGHDTARAALKQVGDKIATEMLEGAVLPENLSRAEFASLFASWINEVAYASIEAPRVEGDRANFDIHYCPHEDVYGAFDCRVQRYFVEGMIAAARRSFGEFAFDVAFTSTIPSGSPTCHFDMYPHENKGDDWNEYSDNLRNKALKIVEIKGGKGV
ncbi:MAG: hypothetical protein ABIS18_04740 [Actinomycetota bacterium]